MRVSHPRAQDGFVTVVVVALAGVLLACGLVSVLLGAAVVARHRAASAADLAALAGAIHLGAGQPGACRAARRVAGSQGARLAVCRLSGSDLLVIVELDLTGPAAALGPVRASARAGPR